MAVTERGYRYIKSLIYFTILAFQKLGRATQKEASVPSENRRANIIFIRMCPTRLHK